MIWLGYRLSWDYKDKEYIQRNCHLLHVNQEKENHNKRKITSKRTVDLRNTNTNQIGNGIIDLRHFKQCRQ